MKQICLIVQPFDLFQRIVVYDNNNLIGETQVTMNNLPNRLCDIAKNYNVTEIKISGPINYTKHIEQKIKEKELEKYENNILTFNYID